MLPNEGYITTEDGVRVFFRKVGNAANLVLIPNGMCLFDDFKCFADSHTLVFYDVRNRGLSDPVGDKSKLVRGIHQDVEDLNAVRRYFGANQIDLIGHSYIGLMVALYATKYPTHINRVVQIGPSQPDSGKQYPAHLTGADDTLKEVLFKLAQMQKEKRPNDPEEACRQFWSVLRVIYVVNPTDADRVDWGRCNLPNERSLMKYWMESILPSIQSVHLTAEQLAQVTTPVLIIHGTRDRSAPYGGAREWAMIWPNARLLTVEKAAHAPWIEAPELFLSAISDFLKGKWPQTSEEVKALDPLQDAKKP